LFPLLLVLSGGHGAGLDALTDKSGFFANYLLMAELKNTDDALEYFLKRQVTYPCHQGIT